MRFYLLCRQVFTDGIAAFVLDGMHKVISATRNIIYFQEPERSRRSSSASHSKCLADMPFWPFLLVFYEVSKFALPRAKSEFK